MGPQNEQPRAEPPFAGATQAVELALLEREINDIHAALNFARQQDNDARGTRDSPLIRAVFGPFTVITRKDGIGSTGPW